MILRSSPSDADSSLFERPEYQRGRLRLGRPPICLGQRAVGGDGLSGRQSGLRLAQLSLDGGRYQQQALLLGLSSLRNERIGSESQQGQLTLKPQLKDLIGSGASMNVKYTETARAGLAVNIIDCWRLMAVPGNASTGKVPSS